MNILYDFEILNHLYENVSGNFFQQIYNFELVFTSIKYIQFSLHTFSLIKKNYFQSSIIGTKIILLMIEYNVHFSQYIQIK